MYDRTLIEFIENGFLACLAFSVVVLLVFRILKINTPKYVYIAFVVLFLTWDNIYANAALYYLGVKEGGEHISKIVEDAGGYYDITNTLGCDRLCEERLMTGEYIYISRTMLSQLINGFS